MIEHILNTGTTGQMRIRDYTDDPDAMFMDLAMKSSVPVSVPQLPWSHSRSGVISTFSIRSFNFQPVTTWQQMATIFINEEHGPLGTFTFNIWDTGSANLNGPTNFTIVLAGSLEGNLIDIKVDGVWKKATPYVKHEGVWKVAQPFVKSGGVWKTTV